MSNTRPYRPAPGNQRLDPELYQQANRVVFITICAYSHSLPFTSERLNHVIIETLRSEQTRLGCLVHTYCLMPNHLHFLASPAQDGQSVLRFTDQFKGKTTRFSWQLGRQGKLWQPRYYDHIVRSHESLLAIAEYILYNPVRKALIGRAEDWPWSDVMTPLPL